MVHCKMRIVKWCASICLLVMLSMESCSYFVLVVASQGSFLEEGEKEMLDLGILETRYFMK